MPGTIQVSVLEFKNVSSSSPASTFSLWVSMGKRVYQTWDKGDFSFPLTTFRENLVVRLQDAEGNEISSTGVRIVQIIEKGFWDDIFQLEGGGYVHMKLQFILNEDDRKRIRNVRETALKKKQDIVPVTNVEYTKTASLVSDTIASSIPIKKEFSDRSEATSSSPMKQVVEIHYPEPDRPSPKKLETQLLHDTISVRPVSSELEVDVAAKNKVSSKKIILDLPNEPYRPSAKNFETQLLRDTISVRPVSPTLEVDVAAKDKFVSKELVLDQLNEPARPSVKNLETQLLHDTSSVRPVPSELEADVAAKNKVVFKKIILDQPNEPDRPSDKNLETQLLQDTISVRPVSSKLEVGVAAKNKFVSKKTILVQPNEPDDQLVEKTPSSVRNMISAFETGLGQKKGRRSLTRNRASKSQPNIVGMRGSVKVMDPKSTGKPDKMSAQRLESSLDTGNLPETQRNIGGRGEGSFSQHDNVVTRQPVFHKQLKQLSADIDPFKEEGSNVKKTLRFAKEESYTGTTSPSDLMRLSNLETETSFRRLKVLHSDIQEAHNLAADQHRSNDPTVAEEQTGGINVADSDVQNVHNMAAAQHTSNDPSVAEERTRGIYMADSDIQEVHNLDSDQHCSNDPSVADEQTEVINVADSDIQKGHDLAEERAGGINVAPSDIQKTQNLAADQHPSSDPSVAEEQTREMRSNIFPEIHFERASNEKPKSIAYCENQHCDSENSGLWIFPDNKTRLCITTAGKKNLHSLEDFRSGVSDCQRKKRPSMQEISGKDGFSTRSDHTIKKDEEKPHKLRKSQSASSGENGPSGPPGPVRQVIKIAVIVGFGIFVLLSRQKETRNSFNRKSDRKSKDPFVTSPDFMDRVASSEEKWSLLTEEGD